MEIAFITIIALGLIVCTVLAFAGRKGQSTVSSGFDDPHQAYHDAGNGDGDGGGDGGSDGGGDGGGSD